MVMVTTGNPLNFLKPELLAKLATIVALGRGAHGIEDPSQTDATLLHDLLSDLQVAEWLKDMRRIALVGEPGLAAAASMPPSN